MKKLLLATFVFVISTTMGLIAATIPISNLNSALSLSGSEFFPLTQNGTTLKSTLNQVWSSAPILSLAIPPGSSVSFPNISSGPLRFPVNDFNSSKSVTFTPYLDVIDDGSPGRTTFVFHGSTGSTDTRLALTNGTNTSYWSATNLNEAGPVISNNGVLRPTYNLAGSSVALSLKGIRITGSTSYTTTTCGPFTNAYCTTITLPTNVPFSAVNSTSTSFDCGGGESLAANNYWLHDFTNFAVEWSDNSKLYIIAGSASLPFSFSCEGV